MIRRIMQAGWIAAICIVTTPIADGQEKQKPEVLKPPRVVIESPPIIVEPIPFFDPRLRPQMGTRDVWQFYGVANNGNFRPRVIYSPHGAYYLYNGRPYPWTTTRPTWYRGLMAR